MTMKPYETSTRPVNPNLLVISIHNWDIYQDIFSVGVQGYNPNDHIYHLTILSKHVHDWDSKLKKI